MAVGDVGNATAAGGTGARRRGGRGEGNSDNFTVVDKAAVRFEGGRDIYTDFVLNRTSQFTPRVSFVCLVGRSVEQ